MTGPIVALTANAVSGQADAFLANGFDGFVSKPIDVRQMNVTLKKFVRDRRPAEAAPPQETPAEDESSILAANPNLVKSFLRDAVTAAEALEAVQAAREKNGAYGDEDRRTYTISTHSMKTALAIAGEADLSAVAERLEEAGCDGNTDVMSSETRRFLRELRAVIEKFTPPKPDGGDAQAVPNVEPALARAFARDAEKAIGTLEAMLEKGGARGDEDVQAYVIQAHAMKSALANIGETALSADAARLEQAGRDGNADVIASCTRVFLKALREVVNRRATEKREAV